MTTTTGEMLKWTDRFKEIMAGKSALKDARLANLMSDLEYAYGIPALKNIEFEKKNPYLMQLYRTVSAARDLKGGER